MMKFKTCIIFAAFVALAGTAIAADNTNVNVSATISAVCAISGSDDIAFGDIDPSMGANIDLNGAVDFWCTNGTTYTITINGNQEAANTAIPRTMADGSENLAYTFMPTSGPTGSGLGAGTPVSYEYTATLTPGAVQAAKAGTYSDTLTIAITP